MITENIDSTMRLLQRYMHWSYLTHLWNKNNSNNKYWEVELLMDTLEEGGKLYIRCK